MPKKEMRERRFRNGEIVFAGFCQHEMKVISAIECLRGWRYQLRFMKKDKSVDKRRTPWYYFEDEILKTKSQ